MFKRAFRYLSAASAISLGVVSTPVWAAEPPLPEEIWSSLGAKLTRPNSDNNQTYIVVGGGPSAYMCVQGLRASGFTGKILLISPEQHLPYDKAQLGVNLSADVTSLLLGTEEFYRDYGVEVLLSTDVDWVNNKDHKLRTKDGKEFSYHKLCIATDGITMVPTHYTHSLKNLDNFVTIREAHDHEKVVKELPGAQSIVIVGATLKGFEVAASILKQYPDKQVYMLDSNDQPLQDEFGNSMAQTIVRQVQSLGLRSYFGAKFHDLTEESNKVASVKLQTKNEFKGNIEETLPTDLMILTTESRNEVEFLPPSLLQSDGLISVDSRMRTVDSNIYAVGDSVSYPNLLSEHRTKNSYVPVSQLQALYAAQNMAGNGHRFLNAPVYSANVGVRVDMAGHYGDHDWFFSETLKDGPTEEAQEVTYFYKQGRCVGVAVYNNPELLLKLKQKLDSGRMPSPSQLTSLKTVNVINEE